MNREQIIEELKKIQDPELQIDIWTLGLIYELKVEEQKVSIKMTFTSPMCPYGPMIVEDIKQKLAQHKLTPHIEIVFTPPWQPSETVKEILGMP